MLSAARQSAEFALCLPRAEPSGFVVALPDEAFRQAGQAKDPAELCAALLGSRVLVRAARPDAAGGLAVTLAMAPGDVRLTRIGVEDWPQVEALARQVSFLPKTTWRFDHVTMMGRGIASGKWQGLGLVEPGTGLLSYLDYKPREDGVVEIGFCMTRPDRRGQRLMHRLVAMVLTRRFDQPFYVSTHEGNVAMRRVLEHLGFRTVEARPGERVNGEASVYYGREPRTPFAA